MKHWAWLVAFLYLLVLALFLIPFAALALWLPIGRAATAYADWGFWACLLVMAGSQLALLAVPVRITSQRPVTKGALWPTALAAGLAAAALIAAAIVALDAAVFGDKNYPEPVIWTVLAAMVGLWITWAVVFHRLGKRMSPSDFVSSLCRRLLKGSVLELLVAVPCHVVVRCRNTCCAEGMSFLGLALGISVMLFAFGPAVYFLFVARARRLQLARDGAGLPPGAP